MKHYKAFTLIEVLVSLWIVTVAVMGPLAVAITSSKSSKDSKDISIASYLAQESVELLRFQRDSIFLRCINDAASCPAQLIPNSATEYEQNHETAWRLFKELLSNGGGSESCFEVENSNGCTYDIETFLTDPTSAPTIYNALNAACTYLYRDDRKQDGVIASSSPTDGMYLCSDGAGDFKPTVFKRTVKITSVPSILPNVSGSYDEMYNDDLRVEVIVSYSTTNFLTKKVKAVDFIRARI
jgi:type II secretory pathway pseudopilin PulG